MLSEIWSATDIIFYHFVPFFCPFTLLTTWKIKILKNEKSMEELSHYTCVPQMTIIWCMVPEIWNPTDIIFCHFLAMFCFFTSLTTQKIKTLKKWKSVPKIMIICHTVPEIWCVTNVIVIFRFGLFSPFTPVTAQEIKIKKKERKKRLEISFYTSVPKIMIRHTVLEIRRATDERTDKRKKWHIEVGAHLKNRFGRPSLSQCFFPECPKW